VKIKENRLKDVKLEKEKEIPKVEDLKQIFPI
jgi:hypothetical protein